MNVGLHSCKEEHKELVTLRGQAGRKENIVYLCKLLVGNHSAAVNLFIALVNFVINSEKE